VRDVRDVQTVGSDVTASERATMCGTASRMQPCWPIETVLELQLDDIGNGERFQKSLTESEVAVAVAVAVASEPVADCLSRSSARS
jgi:hypothetical protein